MNRFITKLRDAGRENYAVAITWWKRKKKSIGTTCRMWGKVERIDTNIRKVKLLTDEDVQWIPMDTIIDVSS